MDIHTVCDNLKNTIAGKELTVQSYRKSLGLADRDEHIAISTMIKFLEINIDELRKILADVEKCCEKDIEQSWRDNPDRSGGQFTQDEIDNYGRWI